MARLTKFDIACMIEKLPGNRLWSASSVMTTWVDIYTRAELVERYNSLVERRCLDLPKIS